MRTTETALRTTKTTAASAPTVTPRSNRVSHGNSASPSAAVPSQSFFFLLLEHELAADVSAHFAGRVRQLGLAAFRARGQIRPSQRVMGPT